MAGYVHHHGTHSMAARIVGVVGGSVGSEPFHPNTWSGSSQFFFNALKHRGSLDRAFGAQIPAFMRYALMAKNFSVERNKWRKQFYLDRQYRNTLTRTLRDQLKQSDYVCSILQVGAQFNMPEATDGRAHCFSYHDSNIAEYMQSRFAATNLPKKRVDEAFAYERELYHSVDKVLTMSEYHRQSFIHHFGVSPHRAVNVGCAPNLETFPDYVEDKPYDSLELLFIGVDFDRKGGTLLLNAFKTVRERYPKAKLHIVGPRQLSISPELSGGVVYHGFLSKRVPEQRRQIEDLLKRACLFVLPSFYEGVGISSLEAMLYQTPCVVTDAWGFRDAIRPGETGYLVECGSTDDLVAKLCLCLSNPADLKRMGETGRNMVLQQFTWERVAERIENAVAAPQQQNDVPAAASA